MTGDWFEGMRKRRRRRPRPTPEPAGDDELVELDEDEAIPCVYWFPIRCPACRSKHQRNYRTQGRVRYHLCQDCAQRFKSFELEDEQGRT